jgi:unsaturated rhamnogalacturonyl hydrolase
MFRKANHITCILITMLAFSSACAQNYVQTKYDSNKWSVKMTESIIARNPNYYAGWDYVTGTVLKAISEVWELTNDSDYYTYIKRTVDYGITSTGTIKGYLLTDYNLDEINEGRMVLMLYNKTGEEKYKKVAELLYEQLSEQPRTSEGGFWHKKKYPNQMWLDGLYMGSPFLAEYAILFDSHADLGDVVRQAGQMEKHMRDSVSGLLYHGWDESKTETWSDSITGCSPTFWGRAIGWYAMAVLEILDCFPKEYAERDSLIHLFQRLAKAIKTYQDSASGCWYQVLDQGNREGNYLEASVSCMFTYSLAKAARLGYIDTSYFSVACKGYKGILNKFITKNADGTLNIINTCATAGLGYGRDGSYDYYVNQTTMATNDGKSLGPFILASLEIEKLDTSSDVTIMVPEKKNNDFKVILNHSNSRATIEFSSLIKSTVFIQVYDMRGCLITNSKYISNAGKNVCEIGLQLIPGLYLLRLKENKNEQTIKFLKN